MDLENLKYPIGRDDNPPFTSENKDKSIDTIRLFPRQIKDITSKLTNEQLDSRYRPEGWSIRQVVHHCADSHMNALRRFKLALTEDNPTIKPYLEAEWAKLADYKLDIEISLGLLESIHKRWTVVLENMTESDFKRTYFHPESQKVSTMSEVLMHYDWHSRHHLAHIHNKVTRENWK